MICNNACRVCKMSDGASRMIKYSVRHYAHPKCALERWGAKFFDRLTPWQLSQFPAPIAAKAGLFDELKRRVDANHAQGLGL